MIPSGNPPNYGIATVSAHAVMAGKQGNIPADAIDQIYGSAMSLKNLIPFTGGLDASTKPFVTADDQEQALKTARQQLTAKQPLELLTKPCTETVSQHHLSLSVVWSCQYVTYRAPKNGQVLSVQVSGNSVILSMRIVARPIVTHFVK
jgi:hypothetical protein